MTLGLIIYSIAFTQDMKGMDMSKKETPKQQPATYTCPMHPEIHATKPGNCPKCGMKLVKEKIKPVKQTAQPQKHDGMQMATKDSSKKMDNMDHMQMPLKDTSKKMEQMDGMKMGDKDSDMDKSDIEKAKKNLGPIKTIVNNMPPHTVRYDLYIADTVVTFGKKKKRATIRVSE